MTWQHGIVTLIVTAAVVFLARRILGAGKPTSAVTFVPLGRLKRPSNRDTCH